MCDYCENEKDIELVKEIGIYKGCCIGVSLKQKSIFYIGHDYTKGYKHMFSEKAIYYCPMCGKKL